MLPLELLAQASGDSTAGNQTTQIILGAIAAVSTFTTACASGFFAYLMVRVNHTVRATHRIINHDREVNLAAQAQTLRVAVLDHPEDAALRKAWERAEAEAQGAREGNQIAGLRR